MKRFSEKKYEKLNESVYDTYINNVGSKYKQLKIGILKLLDEELKNNNKSADEVVELIKNYLMNDKQFEYSMFFYKNNDILNFYFKYQNDIDELCIDYKFFDERPSDNEIFSLYDFIIKGTIYAFNKCLNIMLEETF